MIGNPGGLAVVVPSILVGVAAVVVVVAAAVVAIAVVSIHCRRQGGGSGSRGP
jgi:hypothetical protein